MGKMQHIELSVSGKLDTANPSTNRAPGTLLEATDVAPLWWGPRNGFTQQTWLQTTGFFVWLFDGTSDLIDYKMRSQQQFNLATKWTLDVVFRANTIGHSADATVPIFQWDLNGIEAIGLYILAGGSAAGDQRKIRAIVTPTSSPAVAGTPATLTGTTQVIVGTSMQSTHHARLVRDGANLTLTVDNMAEASSSSFSAVQRHEAAVIASTVCHAYVGTARGLATGGNHLFSGRICSAILRAYAASDATKGMRDPSFVRTQATRFALCGYRTGRAGNQEQSLFGGDFATNPASFSGESLASPWFLTRVQGGTYFRDIYGHTWDSVMKGGLVYSRRVA